MVSVQRQINNADSRVVSFAGKWKEYRTRRLMFYLSWLIIPTVAGLLESEYLFIFAGLCFIVSTYRFCYWRCPKCHQYYLVKKYRSNFLARKCLNCSLPLWGDK